MNKAQFCREFCQLLQKTERYSDLADLEYRKARDGEWVTPAWRKENGGFYGSPIDVTADSETSMIKDILKGIE